MNEPLSLIFSLLYLGLNTLVLNPPKVFPPFTDFIIIRQFFLVLHFLLNYYLLSPSLVALYIILAFNKLLKGTLLLFLIHLVKNLYSLKLFIS